MRRWAVLQKTTNAPLAKRVLIGNGRRLRLDSPRVMGVLNITPDSFSDGGELYRLGSPDLGAVVERAQMMLEAGADILDIGAESSRPGAQPVPEAEELHRVMPVLEALSGLDTMLSVDTYKPAVAAQVAGSGAHLINDIGGGRDTQMLESIASSEAAYCIMHMQGEPRTMQQQPRYTDVVTQVRAFLQQQVAAARAHGIDQARLLVDPGFGFGKALEHNLALLRRLPELVSLQVPVLVGLSRKSMLGTLTGRGPQERLAAGVAVASVAMLHGAAVVRTHDVAATVDAARVIAALRSVAPEEVRVTGCGSS